MFFQKKRVNAKNKPKLLNKCLGLLAVVMLLNILVMPITALAAAPKIVMFQSTIDVINWEILAGVIEDGDLGGAERYRLSIQQLLGLMNGEGKEMLQGLEFTTKADGKLKVVDNTKYKEKAGLVGGYSVFQFGELGNEHSQYDTERATTVKNTLVYEINRAYQFKFGESTTYNAGSP